jgi:hypothetical protein
MNLALRSILFILARDFVRAVKSYDMGPLALFLLRKKVRCLCLSPLQFISSVGFDPANLRSNG